METQKVKPAGVVIGIAAIVLTAIFFVVPFIFILVIASKPIGEANLVGVLLAVELRAVRQSGAGARCP